MSRKRIILAATCLVMATLLMAATLAPLSAHTLRLFASVEGERIVGYGYFNGSSRAVHVPFAVNAPDGEPLYSGVTDDLGQFAFIATRRVDHRIRINSGDGHAADFTVSAAELPEVLHPTMGVASDRGQEQGRQEQGPSSGFAKQSTSEVPLQSIADETAARQIRLLREQLDSYHNTIWWHDVIGGIGYIIGIAGLAYGLEQRKARKGGVSS